MTGLIVHADDFGLTKNINYGIEKAHRYGIITSTSVMAVGEAFTDAVEISKDNPDLDIGIHLTLCEENSVLSSSEIPSLLNGEGRLHNNVFNFTRLYLLNRLDYKEIQNELEAQIIKVYDHGIPVTHLDSHQHVHMLPGIFKIVMELAEKYRIKYIRIPRERFSFYMSSNIRRYPRTVQLFILNMLCRLTNKKKIHTIDYFYGFYFGGNLNKRNLLTVLYRIPMNKISEIMCHPGQSMNDNKYDGWQYNWSDEMDALMDEEIKEYIYNRKIQLVGYNNI